MEKLKVLDLFSGIGGFSLGLERAGMETIAFCEIDENCHKVLNKHWPDIPIHTDVKKLKGKDFKNIDVICGGFPCQDISTAGTKKGLKHDGKRTRSGLWEEFKRVIEEIEPRYAIIENVANLRSLGLNQVIKDLWKIGFMCEWHIISARSIGACHLRERVWIIAYPHDKRTQIQIKREHSAKQMLGSFIKKGGARESEFTNSDLPRFWEPFTSEKASLGRWAEASASFRDWWQIKPSVRRVDDGLSRGLDKTRKERVKQLGNSVVPQIPELIGRMILEYEGAL